MPRKLGRRIEDMTKLVALLDVLIIVGRNDGFQNTNVPVAGFIYPVNSVPEAPICMAEGSEDQADFLGTTGDIVGGIVRILNRQTIPALKNL